MPQTKMIQFFAKEAHRLQNPDADHAILCGDFNLVFDSSKDCENYSNVNNPRADLKITPFKQARLSNI